MTDAELREYSKEHVGYEVEMLFGARAVLRRLAPSRTWGDSIIQHALVESYATHVRVLAAFLYSEPGGDDVGAEHFVRDVGAWRAALPKPSAALETARRRANKEVAHLTKKRISGQPPEKAWPFTLADELQEVLDLFTRHTDAHRLDDAVRQLLAVCCDPQRLESLLAAPLPESQP